MAHRTFAVDETLLECKLGEQTLCICNREKKARSRTCSASKVHGDDNRFADGKNFEQGVEWKGDKVYAF